MKIAKRAQQKNFIVNFSNLKVNEIQELIASGKLFRIENDETYRISTSELKEVKVVLDEYGYYDTVGIAHDGKVIHIIL